MRQVSRKLQRNVAELIRRIDGLHQAASRVRDVFSVEVLGLRIRLRDYSLKLIHSNPELHGLKYLELLWRKAWHDPVVLARQLGSGSDLLLDSHLLAGLGQFHNILLNMVETYGWSDKSFRLDFMCCLEYGFTGESNGQTKRTGSKSGSAVKNGEGETPAEWLLNIAARCLGWLGDLSRYRLEILKDEERSRSEVLARKYYTQATRVQPSLGLAYNQLAALSGERNHGLDTLFFYLKCVTSSIKFQGGETNLWRMLDKVEEEGLGGRKEDESASVYLTLLVSALLQERKEEEIISSCQQSLQSLSQALSAERVSADWLLKCAGCILMVIVKLGKNNIAATRVGLSQAWLMALTSQLTGLLVTGLGKALYGEEWAEDLLSVEDLEEEVEEDSSSLQEQVQDTNKKKRRKLADMLRRRRVSNSGSSAAGSDLSEEEDESDDANISLVDSEEEEEEDSDVVVEEVRTEEPSVLDLVQACQDLKLVPALCLCLSWLHAQPDVLSGLGEGGTSFCTKLARLFTLLHLDRYTRVERISRLQDRNRNCAVEEDHYLASIQMFDQQYTGVQLNKDFVGGEVGEMLVRLRRLEAWRDWLTGSLEECPLRWREGRAVLVAPSFNNVNAAPKKCVMKHMAELWLKDEVNNLEKTQIQRSRIIVDGQAMTSDLQTVKRVAGFKQFTLVVPQVVVRELDNIKKSVREARLSIRWLEHELARGHKGLQPQETDQRADINLTKPHRKEEGWARHQVLECVAYFAASKEEEEHIVLLTGDPAIIHHQDPETMKLLNELGVQVENVVNFMQRFTGVKHEVARNRNRSGEEGGRRRGWRRRRRSWGRGDRKQDVG